MNNSDSGFLVFSNKKSRHASAAANLSETDGNLPTVQVSFFSSVHDGCIDALLVDGAQTSGRNLQHNPFIPFWNVELLDLQVRFESSLGSLVGVRNIITSDGLFTCNLTNF